MLGGESRGRVDAGGFGRGNDRTRHGPNFAFTGRDLFDLSSAADPRISPDGRRIAYVRRRATS